MPTIFSCDQAALRTLLSVRPSVCLSVHLTFFTMFPSSYRHEITLDKSDVHAKGQCLRSNVNVTEVKAQFSRFRTVTPVWFHIWRWSDTQSLMLHRKGAILFFKVIRPISRSHGTKITDFDPNWVFSGRTSSLNPQMATTWCTQLYLA